MGTIHPGAKTWTSKAEMPTPNWPPVSTLSLAGRHPNPHAQAVAAPVRPD